MNRYKITPLLLLALIYLLGFNAVSLATAEEPWMDDYNWVLDEITDGYTSHWSQWVADTGYVTVTPNVFQDSPNGSIEIISRGFEDHDGNPCEETYTFTWNLGSNLHTLDLIDGLYAGIGVNMKSTLGDKEPCPGSNDGAFVAQGTKGIWKPEFVEDQHWSPPTALSTTGGTVPVFGWSKYYPQQAEGIITFPEAYVSEENYPEYASLHLFAAVSSAPAGGVMEYSVVYTFKRQEKTGVSDIRITKLTVPPIVVVEESSKTPYLVKVDIHNNGALRGSYKVELTVFLSTSSGGIYNQTGELGAGESITLEFPIPPVDETLDNWITGKYSVKADMKDLVESSKTGYFSLIDQTAIILIMYLLDRRSRSQ